MQTWKHVSEVEQHLLKEITFAELLERAKSQDEHDDI